MIKWTVTMEMSSWQWYQADPTGRKCIKFKTNITLFLLAMHRIHFIVGSRNDRSTPQIFPTFSMGIQLIEECSLIHGKKCSHKNFLEIFLRFLRFQNFLDYRSNMKSNIFAYAHNHSHIYFSFACNSHKYILKICGNFYILCELTKSKSKKKLLYILFNWQIYIMLFQTIS